MVYLGVVGGREGVTKEFVYKSIEQFIATNNLTSIIIVSGACRGVDRYAAKWAEENNVECIEFKALGVTVKDYYERNYKIVEKSDYILALPSKDSRGTWHTINYAFRLKKPIKIIKQTISDVT